MGRPEVGRTGARFAGAPRGPRPADEQAPEPDASAAPVGARFARRITDRPRRRPLPPPPEDAVVEDEPGTGAAPQAPPEPAVELVRGLVRPYVLTQGRTRPGIDLALEALVSTVSAAEAPDQPEHRAVIALCATPCSVAEVAARLRVPLGVARVVVADLAAVGAVAVHATLGDGAPDLAFLERVRDGLRRL